MRRTIGRWKCARRSTRYAKCERCSSMHLSNRLATHSPRASIDCSTLESSEKRKKLLLQISCFAQWANFYERVDNLDLKSLSPRYDNGGLSITDAALLRSIFHVRGVVFSAYVFTLQYDASLLDVESIEELLANFSTIVKTKKALLTHYHNRFDDVFMKFRRIFTIFDTERCVKAMHLRRNDTFQLSRRAFERVQVLGGSVRLARPLRRTQNHQARLGQGRHQRRALHYRTDNGV